VLRIEVDREEDGRWIAEVIDIPGVLAYGATRDEALDAVKVLSLQVTAEPEEP
jgi:predicted RNase H-like HicB family nuclease